MAPLRDLVAAQIASMTETFKRTHNPAAAWHAYAICRKTSRPVPDIIQTEIDRFASCISKNVEEAIKDEVARSVRITKNLSKKKHGEKPDNVMPVNFRAPGLYKAWRGKFSNPVGALQDEWRDYGIVEAVQLLIDDGMKTTDAYDTVAGRDGVNMGADMVKRICDRYRDQ